MAVRPEGGQEFSGREDRVSTLHFLREGMGREESICVSSKQRH